MGTTLHAIVQQRSSASEHVREFWDTISTWRFNKDYDFSMLLGDIQGHQGWPNDTKPDYNSDIESWTEIEDAFECGQRHQMFSPSDLAKFKGNQKLWPRPQSFLASLEPLGDLDIRILIYRG